MQKDYLEANGISVEEFHWPLYETSPETGLPITDEDNAWSYFQTMMRVYRNGEDLNNTSDFIEVPLLPSDLNCKLMRAVMDGIINWYELPENSGGSLFTVATYVAYEEISKNIDFTN